MPYSEAPTPGRCLHCNAETSMACRACAHHVCSRCQTRHDEQFPHKTYTG